MARQSSGDRIVPVILSGGSGTRLWPRSRHDRPKPFLPLVSETTLFEDTLDRVGAPEIFAPPIVVAGEAHRERVEGQSQDVAGLRLIVEPVARNTAPAIGLAALSLEPEAVMLVCPSDHHIGDPDAFVRGALAAAALARQGYLVAFGIAPSAAATGYGYIRKGASIAGGHRIAEFVEKPDADRAARFLASGEYLWNGGIFAMRAGDYLAELARLRPAMAELLRAAMHGAVTEGAVCRPARDPVEAIAGESIDYAVMENTPHAAVVGVEMDWSDIGSWDALMAMRQGDADGNRSRGPATFLDSRDTMIDSDGPHVSAVGVEGLIIVVDGDRILVTSRDGAQAVGVLPGMVDP